MKVNKIWKMLIANTVVVILLIVANALFNIFGYGACPTFLSPIITSLSLYAMMFLTFIALPCLFIADIVTIFKRWVTMKWICLLPLLVLLAGVGIATIPIPGVSLGEKRFLNRLPEYDAFVDEIKGENLAGTIDISYFDYRGLAYIALAYENEPNVLVVEFVVGGMGPPPKHTAFLYTSSGKVGEKTRADKRWYRWKRMNENWFRVSD
ncbi:MAG: hypothetical protein ACYS1A_10415 [Planctomycetota bacterium]|jgi:hypothetical protein